MNDSPAMLSRPTDPPSALRPLRSSDRLTELHAKYADLFGQTASPASFVRNARARVRLFASHLGTGSDRELLGYLVRAIDEVALRCDELTERVSNVATSLDEVARALGEEVTDLRLRVDSTPATEIDDPPSSRS
jgi:hypothetical protein